MYNLAFGMLSKPHLHYDFHTPISQDLGRIARSGCHAFDLEAARIVRRILNDPLLQALMLISLGRIDC